MQQTCTQCSTVFEITDDDLAFLDRIAPVFGGKKCGIPPPTHCPECRLQRRLAFRNEQYYHHRECALTGEPAISIYSPEDPYVVYSNEAWWSDGWEPLEYGRDVAFNRSFIEQFAELHRRVPRMALQQSTNENSKYSNYVSHLKNCYMIFTSDFNQDCYYGFWIEHCKNCVDNFLLHSSEQSYGCIFCQRIFDCRYAYFSSSCSNCTLIADCRNCQYCALCTNVRNKKYCFENKQCTPEEYEQKLAALALHTHTGILKATDRLNALVANAIHPPMRKQGTVIDSTGDFLVNVEHCTNCYEVVGGKDCKNVLGALDVKDARDCCYANAELGYENCECFPLPHQSCFNLNCYTGSNLFYCDMCMNNCSNLFGCVALKHKEHCILNKQYSKQEYEALVPRIIEHMRKCGEWGEYFPISLSPFTYNESEAFNAYPLKKDEVEQEGWRWREITDEIPEVEKVIPAERLPDSIHDIPDDIVHWAVTCEKSKRPFRITKQELQFYHDKGLSIPHLHPDERHRRRMALRNPRRLWKRQCGKCRKEIETSYEPSRPEIVYCEECYLNEVY
jgi:hypothetical protein